MATSRAPPPEELAEPLVPDEDPKPDPAKRVCCGRIRTRDVCGFGLGFFAAMALVGAGLVVFLELSSSHGGSGQLTPLATPRIVQVAAVHPGWLQVRWAGLGDVQWELETQADQPIWPGKRSRLVGAVGQWVAAGLDGSRQYCFRIRGYTVAQTSAWSAGLCNSTAAIARPGQPGPPSVLSTNGSLQVRVLPPQLLQGHSDDGGDHNMSYYCESLMCSGLDASGCGARREQIAPGQNCTVANASQYGLVVFWSTVANSAGRSPLSDPLTCVNTSRLAGVAGLPAWSCSSSAAPAQPVLNISSVSADGAQLGPQSSPGVL